MKARTKAAPSPHPPAAPLGKQLCRPSGSDRGPVRFAERWAFWFISGLLLLAAPAVSAATFTWIGFSDGIWSTGSNWTPSGPPNAGGGDAVVFNTDSLLGAAATTINLNGSQNVNSLTFAAGSATQGFSIGGGTLTVNTTAGVVNNDADAMTFSGTFVVGTSNLVSNAAAGGLNYATVFLNNADLTTRTFIIDGAFNTIITGSVQENAGNPGAITKQGAGTLTLSAANTYSGGTTVLAGTVESQNASGLGSGNVTLGGGTLSIATVNQTYIQVFTASSASTIDVASGFTFTLGDGANDLTGAGALTKTGSGQLTLGFANNFSGGLSINAGQVNANADGSLGTGTVVLNGGTFFHVGNRSFANPLSVTATSWLRADNGDDIFLSSNSITGTPGVTLNFHNGIGIATARSLVLTGSGFTFASNIDFDSNSRLRSENTSGTQTFSGVISGTGYSGSGSTPPGTIARSAAGGTTILSGANSFTGPVAVTAGTLVIQHSTALGTTAGGTTVSSGAALHLQGNISVGTEALSLAGTGIANTGALLNLSGNNSWSGAVTLTAASTIQSTAGTLALSGNINVGAFGLTLDGAGATTLSGVIGATAGTLTKQGSGNVTLAGNNAYTGGATLTAGNLTVNSGAALAGATAPLAVNGGTLNLNNAAQTVSALSGSGGTINLASGHVLTLNQASSTSFAGTISGAGALSKSNAGTLLLSGTNTYTGRTTISGGTLALGTSTAWPSGSAITLDGGTLDLAGFNATGSTLAVGAGGGTISLGNGVPSTLALAASQGQTWSGTLTINNYTTASGDSLRFGTDANALTSGQLAAISFTGFASGSVIDAAGFVAPVPEPATVALVVGAGALVFALRRRGRK